MLGREVDGGGVGAVGAFAEGEGLVGGTDFHGRFLAQEILDLLVVLGRLDGAGGVDDASAGSEAGEGVLEDAVLDAGEFFDLLGGESPSGIDAAAEDAGVGAGDVEEDGVELTLPFIGGGLRPVEGGGGADLDAEFGEVVAEAGESFLVLVGAEEVAIVVHRGGDEGGLATGSGAGVEDRFAGSGSEELHGVGGGGVLDVGVSAIEKILRNGAFDFEEAGIVFERGAGGIAFDGTQGIESQEGRGGIAVPGHEGVGGIHAELLAPAFVEPVGVGEADGGIEIAKVLGKSFAGCDGAAEDGIDESADGGPGAVHRFVDGGVIGDAEDEKLADADAKDIAGFVIEFSFAEEIDPMVEETAVAEDAEEDRIEQSPV